MSSLIENKKISLAISRSLSRSLTFSPSHTFSRSLFHYPPLSLFLSLSLSHSRPLCLTLCPLSLSLSLSLVFSLSFFVFGPGYSFPQRHKCCLVNFLFGQAKLAVWLTRRNKIQQSRPLDPLMVFREFVEARFHVNMGTPSCGISLAFGQYGVWSKPYAQVQGRGLLYT